MNPSNWEILTADFIATFDLPDPQADRAWKYCRVAQKRSEAHKSEYDEQLEAVYQAVLRRFDDSALDDYMRLHERFSRPLIRNFHQFMEHLWGLLSERQLRSDGAQAFRSRHGLGLDEKESK